MDAHKFLEEIDQSFNESLVFPARFLNEKRGIKTEPFEDLALESQYQEYAKSKACEELHNERLIQKEAKKNFKRIMGELRK